MRGLKVHLQAILVPCLMALVVAELMCYDGKQRWDPEPVINNVTLTTCGAHHKCCYMISSLDGTEFGCYDDCPSTTHYSCGPDPKLGIQDIYYCYCQSHEDANCKPYLESVERA
uniref:Secreted protein n=1 Tax=Panagrellus redivivus TaxID=6233 RepID=A0A7E4VP22_PANRE